MKKTVSGQSVIIIKPTSGWKIVNFQELREYRDLFFFLVWRDIKVMYAQTILGFSWAIIQPIVQIVIYSFIFGRVAKLETGDIPYTLFMTVAIIPWTFMSQAMTQSSQSLIAGQSMLGKIYFPRLIFPITPILSRMVDFSISMVIVLIISFYYSVLPTFKILLLPLFILLMISVSAGIGIWLSAFAIRFRDVRYAMPFIIRMLMFSAPIVYSTSSLPEKYLFIYALNPIVCVIEGFRTCLLGGSFYWLLIIPGLFTSSIILVSGVLYFKRTEKIFVDVI